MTDRSALDELCALEGIEPAYHDIWGTLHQAPEASLRAFLTEMGIPAGDDRALATALEARLAQARGRALAPSNVVRARQPEASVALRVNALPAGPLRWRLSLEAGESREGALESSRLEPDGQGVARWRLPMALPPGYHRLEVLAGEQVAASTLLIASPGRCWQPERLREGGRVFGPSVQLYALRSARNWGIGDFTDLLAVLEHWAARGADFVGLNPLHAIFPHDAGHASPYSPSSRLFLNVLYLDVEAMEDFAESERARARVASPEHQARLAELRASELVDHVGVAALKLDLLCVLWAGFRARHLERGDARAQAFEAWRAERGPALREQALFDALSLRFHEADPGAWRWPQWPAEFQDAEGEAVRAYGEGTPAMVGFFEYLQWQAELQLAAVARRAEALGLAIGLYLDLALAADRHGAEVWTRRALYAGNAGTGAPPDDFALLGQDWGLPPPVPERMTESGYAHFIAVLRANMRHAGALRIDHVMSLMRLFWVPPGGRPADGAYVRYPFEDLLAIVALESERNRCLVVGEDLGTVPPEVREALGRAEVLSYRLLYFEKQHDGNFRLPSDYPAGALVAASTHDLPTLAGFWSGADLDLRERLGLFPDGATAQRQRWFRGEDRARLLWALEREGLVRGEDIEGLLAARELPADTVLALHAFLARTPCRMLAVQLEDLEGAVEAVNVPGTSTEHPNWRRKLPRPIEEWARDARFDALTEALGAARR